jgi:hypothetical protein
MSRCNSYNWQSGCPNYQMTAFVFFIFKSAGEGEGEGWFEGDSTWLIHYKKKHIFAKTCLPVMPSLLPYLLRQLKNNPRIKRIQLEHRIWRNLAKYSWVAVCVFFTVRFFKYLNLCFSWMAPRKKWNCRGKLSHTHHLLVSLFVR